MHTISRVVTPFVLSPDPGVMATPEELARIQGLRSELQAWFLTAGYALLMADVLEVPDRGDWDAARFHTPGGAYAAAQDAIAARYPQQVGAASGHIALVFLVGVTAAEFGAMGGGEPGWAMVAWDAVEAAGTAEKRHWLAGVTAHELGHSCGLGHVMEPAPNVMYHWWSWPGVHILPSSLMVPSAALRLLSVGDGMTTEVCPMPPETNG